jgi:hypothetical protein
MMTHADVMAPYPAGSTNDDVRRIGTERHRAFYGQFVTDRTKALAITVAGGLEPLQAALAADSHLNGIPLGVWDRHAVALDTFALRNALKERGAYVTKSTLVCVLKEAARLVCAEGA